MIYDKEDNIIAFSGSMNESANAFFNNYEAIDVFTSWTHDSDRVARKVVAFDSLWKGNEHGVKVLNFPDVTKEILRRYKVNDKVFRMKTNRQPLKLILSSCRKIFPPSHRTSLCAIIKLQRLMNGRKKIIVVYLIWRQEQAKLSRHWQRYRGWLMTREI